MSDEFNTAGLDTMIKLLGDKLPVAKVGILGLDNARSSGGYTNSEIGTFHEFGTSKLPERSFLRIPISEHLKKYMEKAGAFTEDTIQKVIKQKSLIPFVTNLGFVGVQIVGDAFATGGFGKWKPSNMTHKKVEMTLVETQQLRNSISSEVTK